MQQVCTQQQEQASVIGGLVGEIHGDIKEQATVIGGLVGEIHGDIKEQVSVIGGLGSKVGDIKGLLEQQGNLHAEHSITKLNQMYLGTVRMD